MIKIGRFLVGVAVLICAVGVAAADIKSTVFGEGVYALAQGADDAWRSEAALAAGLEVGGETYRARLAIGL